MWHNEQILVGKRLSSQGEGTWAPPGGGLEIGETPEECAARELFEETGLEADYFRVVDAFPWVDREGGYNIIVACDYADGKLENREPSKCAGWEWRKISDIPSPIYPELARWLERSRAND